MLSADVKQLCFPACAPGTWLEWFNQTNPASLLHIFSSSWHRLLILLLNCSFNPWKQCNDEALSCRSHSHWQCPSSPHSLPEAHQSLWLLLFHYWSSVAQAGGPGFVACGVVHTKKAVWGLFQAHWDWENQRDVPRLLPFCNHSCRKSAWGCLLSRAWSCKEDFITTMNLWLWSLWSIPGLFLVE